MLLLRSVPLSPPEEIDKLGRPELVYTTGEILCHHLRAYRNSRFCEILFGRKDIEDPKVREQVLEIVEVFICREWAG